MVARSCTIIPPNQPMHHPPPPCPKSEPPFAVVPTWCVLSQPVHRERNPPTPFQGRWGYLSDNPSFSFHTNQSPHGAAPPRMRTS